jgi:hypothetical protein
VSDVLERLAAALRERTALAPEVVAGPAGGEPARHGPLAASGPRAAERPEDYELLVEAIREGYLLHYARARIVRTDDEDVALLAGDRLYAFGLDLLARLDDLEAVAVLADTISLGAAAHAAADPALAEAAWDAGAVAVGWGAGEAHRAASELARVGDPRAAEALRSAAAR